MANHSTSCSPRKNENKHCDKAPWVGLCVTVTTLTELYPGPDGADWNIVDFLQVVLHITLCHSEIKIKNV